MAGQIILSVAYGIDVRPEGDPFVEDAENVLQALILGSKPEATLFDTINWCNNFAAICSYVKIGKFTDASRSTICAELVSRSALQTLCAKVAPHRRQCSTDATRQGEGGTCAFLRVSRGLSFGVRATYCMCDSPTSHIRLAERLSHRSLQI